MKENSKEEDLNYLDSMVKEYKQFGNLYNEDYEDEDRIYQALEHILSDYKRVLKENEELQEKDKNKEKIIRNIREEFLKYDWKNSNSVQTYNQLKSLYESIFLKINFEDVFLGK